MRMKVENLLLRTSVQIPVEMEAENVNKDRMRS